MPQIQNIRVPKVSVPSIPGEERDSVARDIHDTVIQPYIGIQMALAGIREKIQQKQDVTDDIERLISVTDIEISNLRSYARGIEGSTEPDKGMLNAIKRYSQRFSSTSGVGVKLEVLSMVSLNERLAAEIYQMVAEGLSNVRRHSNATEAIIRIEVKDERFFLTVQNDNSHGERPKSFVPRSIAERTMALGGAIDVSRDEVYTTVTVTIPL